MYNPVPSKPTDFTLQQLLLVPQVHARNSIRSAKLYFEYQHLQQIFSPIHFRKHVLYLQTLPAEEGGGQLCYLDNRIDVNPLPGTLFPVASSSQRPGLGPSLLSYQGSRIAMTKNTELRYYLFRLQRLQHVSEKSLASVAFLYLTHLVLRYGNNENH